MKRPIIAGILTAIMAMVIVAVVSEANPAPASRPIDNVDLKDW